VRRNKIHDGKRSGVLIRDGGLGTLEDKGGRAVAEDNDLSRYGRGAWNIAPGSEANLTSARNKE
jgi:hypothetical protein